jgi:hypothetical protein
MDANSDNHLGEFVKIISGFRYSSWGDAKLV